VTILSALVEVVERSEQREPRHPAASARSDHARVSSTNVSPTSNTTISIKRRNREPGVGTRQILAQERRVNER
jgi:hypothetical protein